MLTVPQASERLSVSEHKVRRLVHDGTLSARRVGRTFVLDEEPVAAQTRLRITAGRPLAPATAWAAPWELSGERATWSGASSRSRLIARLRTLAVEDLVATVRTRADRTGLRVLPAYRQRVLTHDGVVATSMSAAHSVGADVEALDAPAEVCCSPRTLAALHEEHGISSDGEHNLVVHAPRFSTLPLDGRAHLPAAAVAADLATSPEVRTRRAGTDLLTARLTTISR